jgi:hypothetical protein
LKLEDTGKWEGGQRTHPTDATRRRVKAAREECREERVTKYAKRGGVVAKRMSMEGRWCDGGCGRNLMTLTKKTRRRGTTHHTTRRAHAQAAQHEDYGFGEALPKLCKCSSSQHQAAGFGRAQQWKQAANGGAGVKREGKCAC